MGLLLLVHSLFLQLLSLLLHGSKTGGKAAGLLCRVVFVLLVLGLEDGKQLLVVGGLAEGPHDSGREEQRDEVVEVQTAGVVVEHEEATGHDADVLAVWRVAPRRLFAHADSVPHLDGYVLLCS